MKASTILISAMALAVLAGCDRGRNPSVGGIEQTKYPGQVSAGGRTSGAIIASTAKPVTDATYAGGTPGIAGGSGGTTSGAATGGTVQETGQGPTSGVTPPSGAQPGTQTQPGDHGRTVAPAPGSVEAPAATNTAPQGAAAPGTLGAKQ
ncbi:hypothetical protein LK542_18850 [Massilia sp. IC2-477]|uniref:hypothetical protein n=1 Tax=unclassified Massilia TaxID=2609279 RepID=UPI001D12B44F|nr:MULTISPECIES: hypothetical protein [unclassified Massilia]MCC2957681.1 hypothetical protein [Massilia sp. IC2-477]MCC2973700.1 hypothetical protein [Massilia sp. IC2-476]